ncbi:MAG: CvpA family protein [Betaproteobacteria bacterium]|nr:CvpA family protein [Betaproteobacteria bacterium]
MALSLALGMWRGLTHEVLSLLGWVLAFYLAQTHADQISPWLPIEAQGLRMASAFVLVMVMALIGVAVVMWMAKALINVVGLGWLDRILGGLFGLLRACLLLLAATAALAMTPLQNADWWRDSHSGPLLSNFLAWVKPLMPIEFGKYLP